MGLRGHYRRRRSGQLSAAIAADPGGGGIARWPADRLLIAYGASGVGALPGLFGLALRGPTSASGASSAEIAARYRLGQHLFRDAGHFSEPTADACE